MKITLPIVKVAEYGYRTLTTYVETTIYGQPGVKMEEHVSDHFLRRLEPATFTVLDYDFKAARRLTGLGKLLAFSAVLGISAPLAVIYVTGEKLGEGMVWFAENVLHRVTRAAAIPAVHSLGGTYRAIFAEIAGR